MKKLLVTLFLANSSLMAQAQQPLKVALAGQPPLSNQIVDRLRTAGGLAIEVVPFGDDRRDYTIAVAQIGSVACTTIVLNRKGEVVATVARGGRFTANCATDASAKELATKFVTAPR